MFRQAMSCPSVSVEVLPVANKVRYEKSLIGQLFTGDSKDPLVKAKSPKGLRAKNDPQPEPKSESRPNARLDARRPDADAKTPEPAAVNTPPAENQSRHGSLERGSRPLARTASSSPTPRSPALPGLASLTSRKGGKRIKIDLKKGK